MNNSTDNFTVRTFAGEEYLNMGNAAAYAGYSGTGFRNLLRRLKGTPDEIPQYSFPGGNERYVKKTDLDKYLSPKRVDD